MPHMALYRKYRPAHFEDLLGQEHIVSALQGALQKSDIAHAYLFAGSRGTGKTSAARIFASELGVIQDDLYEIDAASNRGIDDVRALREAVHTMPFSSPYKCYIIDEVHMLTREAFNALLKTLEEPPSHVLFILATTEIDKLPETVVSRCEVHRFKKPTGKILRDLALLVAEKEGLLIEPQSAELISTLGDGSYRDTLGVLQKVFVAGEHEKIEHSEVERILGVPRGILLNEMLEKVGKGDLEGALSVVSRVGEESFDIKIFLKLFLDRMRFVCLLRYAPALTEHIRERAGEDNFKFFKSLAEDKNIVINSETLLAFLNAYEQVGRSAIPELPLEIALVRLLKSQ